MNAKKLQGTQRRQQIIDNAARLFALYGIDGTSMRNLAHACECNEALLYKHFSSKEELFEEVIGDVKRRVTDEWVKVSDSEAAGYEAVQRITDSILNGAFDGVNVYAFMVQWMAASLRNPDISPIVHGIFGELYGILKVSMDKAMSDGSISQDANPARCAWCIICRGIATSVIGALSPADPKIPAESERLSDYLLECIRPGH